MFFQDKKKILFISLKLTMRGSSILQNLNVQKLVSRFFSEPKKISFCQPELTD